MSRLAAIRAALLASAERIRKRSELAAEAAFLEADDVDRAEMLSVAGRNTEVVEFVGCVHDQQLATPSQFGERNIVLPASAIWRDRELLRTWV